MPSEAQSFVESDLGGNGFEVAQPRQNFPGADTGAPPPTPAAAAAAAAAATTDREGKPTRTSDRNDGGGGSGRGGSRNGGKSAAKEFPLASINAMSCLSRPLATQRGWSPGNGDTTKSLVRAYYAAGKGSQRARRIAARLFCLTGFCLLPVTPDDARVLCEAAGDSLEWGLGETEKPRLVTRPPVRETREQKRALLLRIKVRAGWIMSICVGVLKCGKIGVIGCLEIGSSAALRCRRFLSAQRMTCLIPGTYSRECKQARVCSVRYQYSRYRYGCHTELTEVSGTGTDVVPNLLKCPVPVLMLYRNYPSVRYRYESLYRYRRYRYPCHTELTEVSGTGIDVVPNLPKCPVPVLMTYRTYRSFRCRY